MDDAGARRDDLEVAERRLAPAQEGVALAVALELELDVPPEREPGRVLVDLHAVVDDELGRDQRIDLRRVAAEVGHRVPHRREVDDGRHAGEVLEENPGRREGDLAARLVGRNPCRHGLDVGLGARAQDVLEQDPERVGQPRDVEPRLQRVEPDDLVLATADGERRAGGERVGRHVSNVSNGARLSRSGAGGARPPRT